MTPWDEPLEYTEEDAFEDPAPYVPEPDALTQAVGGRWYVTRYELDECRRRYEGSTLQGEPERFDRYYVHSDVGPLLIDILVGDHDSHDAQAQKKHVAFKRAWCERHERRYLVLTEAEAADVHVVRELLAAFEAPSEPKAEDTPRPARKRSGVQRPKAAA